jgi:hypothetical protein
VIRFDRGFSLVALAGAPVVEYAARIRRLFAKDQPVVAGFSNELSCYLPTASMLDDAGGDSSESLIEFALPAPFTAEVEQRVLDTVRRVWRHVVGK